MQNFSLVMGQYIIVSRKYQNNQKNKKNNSKYANIIQRDYPQYGLMKFKMAGNGNF